MLLSLSLVTGCVSFEPQPDADLISDIALKNDEILQLQDEIVRLHDVIEKKDMKISKQRVLRQEQDRKQEDTSNEVSRIQVKLYRLATKPSAASIVTEAEVAMADLKQDESLESDAALQAQAQYLLDAALLAYEQDDYAVAMSYASQVQEFIDMILDENRKRSYYKRNIVLIHSSIILWAETGINLRKRPNSTSKILNILEKDSSFIVSAYRGNWLRVKSDNGTQGWIFNTLVRTIKKHH